MNDKIVLLKISYIIGFILDALVAIQMFFPEIQTITAGITGFAMGPDYLYAAYMSGVMMLGWCGILLWAYKKPKERMDILLITVFPVVVGLIIGDILSVVSGFLPLTTALLYLSVQAMLIILFSLSYYLNRKE
jgi:hypothetical protein